MKIKESIVTKNPCYTCGRTITVKGLMIHSVGCPQPKASVFFNNWNKTSANVCVHAVLQADGTVLQLLPWNRRGWHCGSGSKGSGNNTHIGVEMTEPNTIKYTGGSSYTDLNPTATRDFVLKTYQTAVELFAYLCKLHNLDPLADGVIISHAEGHKRGIASNHGDVEHIWNKQGLTMAQFRKDIKKAMGGTVTPEKPQEDTKTQTVDGYKVKITTGTLNVRKGPGTNYGIATTVKKGEVYTIVGEAKNGSTVWGKLKSGAGYISLDYTEKLTDGKVTQTTTPAQNTGSYKVKVTADVLNVRKGPGTGYGIATTVKQGEVYTIVDEVKSGNATWGKLKSGAGYISLAYTKRV